MKWALIYLAVASSDPTTVDASAIQARFDAQIECSQALIQYRRLAESVARIDGSPPKAYTCVQRAD